MTSKGGTGSLRIRHWYCRDKIREEENVNEQPIDR